jgi:hypothetical protein
MNYSSPEIQYKRYIAEVNRQLKLAKRQVERIPELKKMSQMSFDDWLTQNNKK